MTDGFLTSKELAARWRVGESTVKGRRRRGEGPPFVKIGRRVLYAESDVRRFEAEAAARPSLAPGVSDVA